MGYTRTEGYTSAGMIIAINTSPLASGHSGRGVGQYTRQLVAALRRYEPDHEYVEFGGADPVPDQAQLVHYPYFDPFFRTLPLIKRKPTVVTVHDLIPLVFPERFPAGIKGTLKWHAQRISLSWATRILTDSDCSKRDIVRIVGFPDVRIDVVRLAPPEGYAPVIDKAKLAAAAKTYHLPKRFILYVGDINWNKNVSGLLTVFDDIAKRDKTIHLVLVGKAFMNSNIPEARQIDDTILSLGLRDRVLRPGYVPDADMPTLYSLATLYVQPSLYEGFGFPVLEAMSSGCPVVTSGAASLSEIAGPARIIDMADVSSAAATIRAALTMTPKERAAAVTKGLAWAKRFSWQTVARETIAVYKKAVPQRVPIR